MAQPAVAGPLGERDLHHELGPRRTAPPAGDRRRRTATSSTARSASSPATSRGPGRGTRTRRVRRSAARRRRRSTRRAAHRRSPPRPLALDPAADDELLLPAVLHLQPLARALAELVARRAALRDDALEPELLARGEHRRTVLGAVHRRRRLPVRAHAARAREHRRAGRGRRRSSSDAPSRHSTSNTMNATGASAANWAWRRASATCIRCWQRLEAGSAGGVERHDLAVEQHRRVERPPRARRARDSGRRGRCRAGS